MLTVQQASQAAIDALESVTAAKISKVQREPKKVESEEGWDEVINLFVAAVCAEDPSSRFTASDIARWAEAFSELVASTGVKVPIRLANSRSVGKYLKKHESTLPLRSVGSYANRQVYAATTEE